MRRGFQNAVALGEGEIVVRLERDGGIETREGIFCPPEMPQSDASVVVEHGSRGLQIDGPCDLAFRRFELVLLEKKHAEKICGLGVPGFGFQNGAIGILGFRDPPALVQALGSCQVGRHVAAMTGVEFFEQSRRIGVLRVRIEDLPAGARGAIKIAVLLHPQRAGKNNR